MTFITQVGKNNENDILEIIELEVLILNFQQFREFGLVKADDDIFIIDNDNRDAHLLCLFNHFLGRIPIGGDIMILKLDIVLCKELLHFLTIRSGRCGIDYDYFIRHFQPPGGFTGIFLYYYWYGGLSINQPGPVITDELGNKAMLYL